MNTGTIITALVLITVIALIIYKMIRDKKNGKSSCDCEHCPYSVNCHSNSNHK